MSAPDERTPDPVEAVLAASRGDLDTAGLRAALLERTTGIIRRRRRVRRFAVAAALLACYLAGAATAETWWPWRPGAPATASHETVPGGGPATVADRPDSDGPPPVPQTPAPDGVGQAVATAKISRFEAYRQAGDRFLKEPAQLSLAVRSYSNALSVASAEERAISPERDSWLLMALKDSRIKERSHGNPDR